MPEALNNALGAAFERLLGQRAPQGTVAFARCLSQDVMLDLCQDAEFRVSGWDIWGVTDKEDDAVRLISADRAVEFREDKKNPMLLLVDAATAGAGMDGIYSAAREITETELFGAATNYVSKQLGPAHRAYAEQAIKKARRLGSSRTLAPWRELAFYLALSIEADRPGKALSHLGLWPISSDGIPDSGELDYSARLVERLLLTRWTSATPEARVEDLSLENASDEQRRELEGFVRAANSLSWHEATEALANKPNIWLNAIRPGVFYRTTLAKIELVPWRTPPKKPASWTGLQWEEDEERLYFYLSSQVTNKSKAPKLEVRWKTQPEDLPKGAFEYKVTVLAGGDEGDELASHTVAHSGKAIQKTSFTLDDFEIEETATFEALIRIQPMTAGPLSVSTEPFILTFGETKQNVKSVVGKPYRSLIEGMIDLKSKEVFEEACRRITQPSVTDLDAKNFIGFRYEGAFSKVFRPAFLREVEEDWQGRQGTPGRWRVRVRADGSQAGPATFIPSGPGGCSDADWARVLATSKALCNYANSGKGLLGIVHCYTNYAADYINAWGTALDAAEPALALAHTVEVQSLSGHTLGLIVLPSHPVKLAWQQAYDQLVQHSRYEEGFKANELRETLEKLDSAYTPAFLPGFIKGHAFVFGDTLSFHFTAMVRDDDKEPKATIALLAALLSKSSDEVASSVGLTTSKALTREVQRYLELHGSYDIIRTHAVRAGDAMTVTRALGGALKAPAPDDDEASAAQQSFVLELFPSKDRTDIAGRFLLNTVDRARSSGTSLAEEDRWIVETYSRPGNISLPKLKWARRSVGIPEDPGHLTIVFDSFDSQVRIGSVQPNEKVIPLELYGLAVSMVRDFCFEPEPHWRSYVAPVVEGEKHPVARGLTDRLVKLHNNVLRSTAKHLGGRENSWPQSYTTISVELEEVLRRLHTLSDWVITIDKNAGVEYFDSPHEKQNVYDAYVIDCIPEREDLGALQLVTSTSKFEEILGLLDTVLVEMDLSASPRNCEFLLNELKGLSGRLAIRLANQGAQSQEMIALGLVHYHCHSIVQHTSPWLSLSEGFFVPLDDVPGFQPVDENTSSSMQRADLLYITAKRGAGLQFSFIEVKFRRHLGTARSVQLIDTIHNQLRASRQRFVDFFGDKTPVVQRSLRRSWLARLLRFYADRGFRHFLSEEAYQKISREIDRMVREGKTYTLFGSSDLATDRGFVFCPEYGAVQPSRVSSETPEVWLFGASEGLETFGKNEVEGSLGSAPPSNDQAPSPSAPKYVIQEEDSFTRSVAEGTLPATSESPKFIELGQESVSLEPSHWKLSAKSNPHLMIVGLPGMGKTTAIINICQQLVNAGVIPIVFSYHEDIDEKLEDGFGSGLNKVNYDGLRFNPMQIVDQRATAYIDNVGMLRDIFSAIFPDLGEVQLGRLRDALKQSYLDQGWGDPNRDHTPPTPDFQAFFELIKASPKPDNGLLLRLGELNDYGFFGSNQGNTSLLDTSVPSLIRIHDTQNENLQRAFAAFVLHNLYKNMFRRGVQSDITHAIIFDEAHRASNLKLLPTLAKESRKYGVSLLIASQETKDFDPSLYSAVANYLVLRLSEVDAKIMAKVIGASDQQRQLTDRIKQMPKYQAFFYGEGLSRAKQINLKG